MSDQNDPINHQSAELVDGGTGSTHRENVGGPGKPRPTDADLRMVTTLASFAATGAELEQSEVARLRVLSQMDLEPADRIVVRRLLAPADAAQRVADEAETERKAEAAKAGAKALQRGRYMQRVAALMRPTDQGGEGIIIRAEAEAKARAEIYGTGK